LTDFLIFFAVEFTKKFVIVTLPHHTLNVLLHYRVKWQLSQTNDIFILKL